MDDELNEGAIGLVRLLEQADAHMRDGRYKVAAAILDELAKDCREVAKKARQTKR